jgi:hypothetical protein
MATTIFSLPVVLFAFLGLPIFSLGSTTIFAFAEQPTQIRTVSLTPKTSPANAKRDIAPSTAELNG